MKWNFFETFKFKNKRKSIQNNDQLIDFKNIKNEELLSFSSVYNLSYINLIGFHFLN